MRYLYLAANKNEEKVIFKKQTKLMNEQNERKKEMVNVLIELT